MRAYLAASEWIDTGHPLIRDYARRLAAGEDAPAQIARRCFEFVRDGIRHSWDHQDTRVTCRASEVLEAGTGYCYAKSHLLAALLRANGLPAGLCYQRLSVNDTGAPFCLHGLNAVWLPEHGWYRIDARGNRRGVNAQFVPPREQLAFPLQDRRERDFPAILAEPLPAVVQALTRHDTVQAVHDHLPDAEEIAADE